MCYNMFSMGRKKVTTTVYLTEDQVAALKELHHRTRVPIAEYIRMGIDLILERYASHLPGQVSLFGETKAEENFGKRPDRLEEYKAARNSESGKTE
jgi:hypothetical protein